jgi:hypothetical protein
MSMKFQIRTINKRGQHGMWKEMVTNDNEISIKPVGVPKKKTTFIQKISCYFGIHRYRWYRFSMTEGRENEVYCMKCGKQLT